MKLRDYQREAVGAALGAWNAGDPAPALLLATGLGKTVIFAELCRIAVRALGLRPAILVHRDELVRQTVDKLQRADPELRIGVIQGDRLGIAGTDVVVASVQTLVRRIPPARARVTVAPDRFTAMIVDECHHASANSYRKILDHFAGAVRLGVTATLARGDGRGLGDVWSKVVYERGIAWGVERGHLVPAEVRTVTVPGLDTNAVRRAADGDLAAGDLGRAMATAHAGERIAEAYVAFGRGHAGLRRAISFAPTVEVAEAWAGAYEAVGARCAVITGTTPPTERQAAYRDVAAGRKDVLSSVMVLTEGFDLPAVEVAIIGRPTKSMALLTQMVGRVLRPSPDSGKEAALILDVVGAMGGGLARSLDLSIPQPPKPVAPRDPDAIPAPREVVELAPPPEVAWVARSLDGQPLAPPRRRKHFAQPGWLRTYGGVPFLPRTKEFGDLLYCLAVPAVATPWWRKPHGARPEPVELAPGADLRELHPGLPEALDALPATDPQVELLARLRGPAGPLHAPGQDRPTRAEAARRIEVHFASRELDRLVRR